MIVLFPSDRHRASRGKAEGAVTTKFVASTAESVDPDDLRSPAQGPEPPIADVSAGLQPQQRQRVRALSRQDFDRHESRSGDAAWQLIKIRAEVARNPAIVSAAAAFLTPMSGHYLIGT